MRDKALYDREAKAEIFKGKIQMSVTSKYIAFFIVYHFSYEKYQENNGGKENLILTLFLFLVHI